MTTVVNSVMTISRDEEEEVVTLLATTANPDDDTALVGSVPVGFGDCLILGSMVRYSAITTLRPGVAEYLFGISIEVVDGSNNTVAAIGAAPFSVVQAGVVAGTIRATAYVEPKYPVLLRTQENIMAIIPELDTSVGPTGDIQVLHRVRRLRNLGRFDIVSNRLSRFLGPIYLPR